MSVYPYDISKTEEATITKLDTKLFRRKSWKPIYFESQMVKDTRNKNSAGVGFCTRVSAGFFWCIRIFFHLS